MPKSPAVPPAEPVEGYVWCDSVGAIHDDRPNPYDGPRICPGPHRALYILEEETS